MKDINADIHLKLFDGSSIPTAQDNPAPMTVGKALANLLAINKAKKFDSFKAFELGGRFYNGGNVQIDDADFNRLKEMVKVDDSYTAIILGQLEKALNEAA